MNKCGKYLGRIITRASICSNLHKKILRAHLLQQIARPVPVNTKQFTTLSVCDASLFLKSDGIAQKAPIPKGIGAR